MDIKKKFYKPRNPEKIYQFKITLKEIEPSVWRRIQVPGTYRFWDLHVAISDAMGWLDYHLHEFELLNPQTGKTELIGIPDEDGFVNVTCGRSVKIADYFVTLNSKAKYMYDFGDGWVHDVVLEQILTISYPRCLDGAGACPPEDCGGPTGYKELLQIIANPKHKEYKERIKWLEYMKKNCGLQGKNFDPKAFDPEKINFWDPKVREKLAFK